MDCGKVELSIQRRKLSDAFHSTQRWNRRVDRRAQQSEPHQLLLAVCLSVVLMSDQPGVKGEQS